MFLPKNFFRSFRTEGEYQNYLHSLQTKVDNGEILTFDQTIEFCSCLYPELALKYSFCDDVRFRRLYLDYKTGHLSFSDYTHLRGFLRSWSPIMDSERNSDEILKSAAKETRDEIKTYLATRRNRSGSIKSSDKRSIDLIYLHSKFLTIITRLILSRRGSNTIINKFFGEEIHIDSNTVFHILTRHYGALTKNYPNNKSYFTIDNQMYELVSLLEELLKVIDKTGLINPSNCHDIKFEFKGKLYQIYLKQVTKQKKGVGNYSVWRVNTFYPIEAAEDILTLKSEYNITKVNDDLKLFFKNR